MKKLKMKTHKGIKGRFKFTKTGKVLHRAPGRRHLMSSKSGKENRQLRGWRRLSAGDQRLLARQYCAR
jgi:large subunit ribosomal protein L35